MRTASIVFLLVSFFQASAHAHEFWIEPETYSCQPDAILKMSLKVGHRFAGDIWARNETRITRFEAIGPNKTEPVIGKSGSAFNAARLKSPGEYIVTFQSNHAFLEMPPEKFEKYLRDEGLGFVVEERKKRGESGKPGREAYSRYCKSLIRVGEDFESTGDKTVGLPLEIILETKPYAIEEGKDFKTRIVFQDKPLAGATVVAVSKEASDKPQKIETDKDGVANFKIDRQGPWMITTIHMIRASENLDADWESFWASYTFEAKIEKTDASLKRQRPSEGKSE